MGVAGGRLLVISASGRAAVFLDRDGVINALVPDPGTGVPESPYRPEDVSILDGVPEALRRLSAAGFTLVVASNQPAAAKGITTEENLDIVHRRVVELLRQAASTIAEWRYCRHHPDAADPRLRECECRKPKPGLLLDAAASLGLDLERSWAIGDADRDVEAGAEAGTRTVLIEHPPSAHRRSGRLVVDLRANSLPFATDALLARSRYS